MLNRRISVYLKWFRKSAERKINDESFYIRFGEHTKNNRISNINICTLMEEQKKRRRYELSE